MPNSRLWELTKFHPEYIMYMFLMIMHERILAQNGGRHFRSSMSVSPIIPQLLMIMSDTQAVPFFSREVFLRMLAFHGTTLHLVRAICGPTTNFNQDTNGKIMCLILGRVVSRIASNRMVTSCFESCATVLLTYPLSVRVPQIPLRVTIFNDNANHCRLKTIWQILSFCTILPEAKAILEISSETLDPCQMKTYDILYMIIIFRRLFEMKNKSFILLCKYLHLTKKFKKQGRSIGFLRKRFEKKLQLQVSTFDFQVFSYYFHCLTTKLLQPLDQKQYLIDASLQLLDKFFLSMTVDGYSIISTPYLSGISKLLQIKDQSLLLNALKMNPGDYFSRQQDPEHDLSFCVTPPTHSSPEWLFSVLQITNFVNVPGNFQRYLSDNVDRYDIFINETFNKINNRFARLLFLVTKFSKFSKSDHPHRHFIFDCVSSMKSTGTTKNPDLVKLLNLGRFQSEGLKEFHSLFKDFCRFADPKIGCSEMTEQSLLCFFEMMHMVLSDKHFMKIFQEFLKKFENEQHNFWNIDPWDIYPMCHSFLENLAKDPEQHHLIQGIRYFRVTNCDDCDEFLDHNNDSGLCYECNCRREMDDLIEYY